MQWLRMLGESVRTHHRQLTPGERRVQYTRVRHCSTLTCLICTAAIAGEYPPSPKGPVIDDYHGTKIADPYRWLENPDSPESRAWIDAQVKYTDAWFAKLPSREPLLKRLEQLTSFTQTDSPEKHAGRYFFLQRKAEQNQPVLYVQNSASAAPRTLIDPNAMDAKGTTAINGWSASPNGKWVAWAVSVAGSDWRLVRIRNADTAEDLPDRIEWIKNSALHWAPDSSGIYYTRLPQPKPSELLTAANTNWTAHFHELKTQQADDSLVYAMPEHPDYGSGVWPTPNGRWLVVVIYQGTRRQFMLSVIDLKSADRKPRAIVDKFEALYQPAGADGDTLFVRTNWNAPRGKVIAIDLNHPEREKWKEIVPETQDAIEQVEMSARHLAVVYMHDVASKVHIHSLDGKLMRDVELPGLGAVTWAEGESKDPEMFYKYVSFADPGQVYQYDVKSGKSTPWIKTSSPIDDGNFETKQVFYPSKDGTKIPMFLVSKRGMKPNPDTPTLLYAYGGFTLSQQPKFSALYVAWIEMGGLVASANLRGGSEYGEAWHQAGIREKKQNVFDDFIGAAEWLIANKYTSSKKLAIFGGSNGGMLVGAALNQRPELFGAAVAAVGVMDMLRFHKFTVGAGWIPEYGNPDDAADFAFIRPYSPIHNIKSGTKYPAMLITTADHDDRVVPGHSFKYAATLQAAQAGPAPILIRIDVSAGHGGGKPRSKQVAEQTDILAFLREVLR